MVFKMNKKLELSLKILLIVLIVSTLTFVFYQSSLPKKESAELSQSASDIIEPYIPSDTPTGAYIHTNIRKIAHFTEFFALGFEIGLYVFLFLRKKRFVAYSFVAAPLVALCDETIQIFSDRGSSVSDVWIDVLGYVCAATAVYLIAFIIVCLKKRCAGAHGKDING